MAAKTIQIEVCDQITKVCRVEKKGKKVRVSDAFAFQTPEGSVQEGVIANPAVLGAELRDQLASHGLGDAKSAAFTITSNKIAVREARLPYMKPKLVGAAVHTNAQDYFPVDLQNYGISYSVLESISGPDGFVRVMAYAAPISLLDGYAQLAAEAGLSVKALDCSGNGQYQLLRGVNAKGVASLYVDVGSGSSVISFLFGDKLIMQRAFAFGADDLVTHYASAAGREDAGYLAALRETDATGPDFAADKVLSPDEIASDLNRFVSGIVRTIDFFNSSRGDIAASRVVLMGTLRHIVGLREQIADATGLETSFLDELPEFGVFTAAAPAAAAYVSCIGSALAPLGLVSYLAPKGKKKAANQDNVSLKSGFVLLAVCVVVAGVLAFFAITQYKTAAQQVTDTQSQIDALAPAKKAYDTYVAYDASQKSLNEVIDSAKTPNTQLKAFFTELENKMPSSILLLSADCTEEGIAMNITVANYQDAAAVVAELREFDSIANIDVSEASVADDDSGASRVSFSVTCAYGTNPYLNSQNPYQQIIAPSPSPNAAAESAAPSDNAGGNS